MKSRNMTKKRSPQSKRNVDKDFCSKNKFLREKNHKTFAHIMVKQLEILSDTNLEPPVSIHFSRVEKEKMFRHQKY